MLQLAMDRCLALLLFLALFASLETAPPSSEKLVRVYEINKEQYERVLQLTKGRNVISEARLINGGFATVGESVSETISSGWHSLLRIVGLTTATKADEAEKGDFESQPLCVIKTREGEALGRDEEVTSARSSGRGIEGDDEDSAIHCIVVLKPDLDLPSQEPHPNYAQYWNAPQGPQPGEDSDAVKQPEEVKVKEDEVEVTTPAPLKRKKTNKSTYPKAASVEEDTDGARQYSAYPLPPQYGTPYPPSPYGGYSPSPYTPYPNPQAPYGPYGQSPYGSLPPFGPPPQQIYVPQPQYPPQQPFVNPYGPQPQGFPYGYGYPYLDQSQLTQANANKEIEKPEADDEDEEDEDSYEEEDDYKRRYYPYRNVPYTQPYNY